MTGGYVQLGHHDGDGPISGRIRDVVDRLGSGVPHGEPGTEVYMRL